MQKNYEYRFQRKPGRYVYLPTDEGRLIGSRIRREVLKRWQPNPIFYHLLRRGGHIAALRRHISQQFFGKRDIDHFFARVTRTKVARALRDIGFDAQTAFGMASDSVVVSEAGKHVPYGFVQSPVLATLVIEKSALGTFLINHSPENIVVTVYVDDISFSSNDANSVITYGQSIDETAQIAGFPFSQDKTVFCEENMSVFNCDIKKNSTQIDQERMTKFFDKMLWSSDLGRDAIIRYVRAINTEQADELLASIDN